MRSRRARARRSKLDYVPLPNELVQQIESYIGTERSSERLGRHELGETRTPAATKSGAGADRLFG